MSSSTQTIPSGHSPDQRIRASVKKHGWVLKTALAAFTATDPLHCYYGEDCNPDEYLSYAEKFIKSFQSLDMTVDRLETIHGEALASLDFVRELVHRAFHPEQLVEGWVTSKDIENIAQTLVNSGIKMSVEDKSLTT